MDRQLGTTHSNVPLKAAYRRSSQVKRNLCFSTIWSMTADSVPCRAEKTQSDRFLVMIST